MNVVWKYTLIVDDNLNVELPLGAKVLSVQEQFGEPQMWVLVNQEQSTYETRKFRLAGTGHPIKENNISFIGTFQLYNGGFVGHLFEINE